MDQFKISGSQNYCKYCHTNSEEFIWIDGGNPIPLNMDLSTSVDCKSPEDLWNNRKTKHGLHSKDLPAQGRGSSNSTAATQNIPPHWAPSPILPRDPLRNDDVVGPILRECNVDPGKLGAAISQLPLTLVLGLSPRGQHCWAMGQVVLRISTRCCLSHKLQHPHQSHKPLTWPIH